MDIPFILEEYSVSAYVVEYMNKANRGISNLQRELIKLRDEYPDKDYSALFTEVGMKMLNVVEISSQEASWYLLNLHMSESSRKVEYIPTVWPHERQKVRKSKKQMDKEEIGGHVGQHLERKLHRSIREPFGKCSQPVFGAIRREILQSERQ